MIGDKLGMNAHYAPLHPVRCLDETNCSSLRGGAFCQGPKVQGEGYEYRQCGKVNLFVAFESLACKSVVKPSDARTAVDPAHSLREL